MVVDTRNAPGRTLNTLTGDNAGAPPAPDAWWWDRLLVVHAHIEHRLGEVIRRHGLGLSEYRALEFLAFAPGSQLRMQDLADALGLNQSSVTRLVGRLQRADFAETSLCADDGRGVYTVLTDAGRERYEQARPAYRLTLTEALDEAREMSSDGRGLIDAARAFAGAVPSPGQ